VAETGYQKGVPIGGALAQAPSGKVPAFLVAALKDPVGNTVDVADASWTNTIGANALMTAWTDPDFDSAQRASNMVAYLKYPRRAGLRMMRSVLG
jgi:hypothetical protein